MWDQRYDRPEYVYGTEPNDFLVSVVDRIPFGRVLCLAEGEGRNAVYLAEKGYEVTAVDSSAVGLAKAKRLAERQGVSIRTQVADLAEYEIDTDNWEGIVSIFAHLQPDLRREVHRQAVGGLVSGGVFVLEAYTPRQLAYGTGGPPSENLMMTLPDLRQELAGLELVISHEVDRHIEEGSLHRGKSAVAQILGVKPPTCRSHS